MIAISGVKMEQIIKAYSVSRSFSSGREVIHALKNINISIKKNALTILKGRSGSGKTTLINSLGTLDKPDKGNIYFEDRDITQINEREKGELRRTKIGFVFQAVGLISNMSAYENIDFGLRLAGYDEKKRHERVRECIDMVGLTKRSFHRAHELSGGEQQRVAIARAIAHKPSIIFADEPTAELDTQMGLQIVKIFEQLIEDEGATVVMTSHDPNIMEIADYVYVLKDGEIVDEE
jgi:putative ABC transport system ATP-binding protein